MYKKYSYKKAKSILKQDLEIPECVDNSIKEAFEKIDEDYDRENVERKIIKLKKISKLKKCAAAVAAIMILGTGTTVTAKTLLKWDDKVAEIFEVDDKMQNDLIEDGIVTELNVQDTVNGVTIETDQMISDDRYMYVLFKITAPEDMVLTKDTFFKDFKFECEGDTEDERQLSGVCGGLYGIETGQKFQEDGKTNVVYWQMYVLKDENLDGKEFTATFVDLGENDNENKTGVTTLVEGTWKLSWKLKSSSKSIEKQVDTQINNSDTVVKDIKITPISILVQYNFPKKKVENEVLYEDGTTGKSTSYETPERGYRVRMTDGTIKEIPSGGPGYEGYTNIFGINYECYSTFNKVLDIDNVQSVIFGENETETEINIR